MDKNFPWKVALVFIVVALSVYFIYPPKEKISLGLDLSGGIHITLRVDTDKIPEKYREGAVERAVQIIQNRIDQFGVREPYITKQGKDEIVVQLPGLTDQERAREVVGKTAHLEFKFVSDDEKVIKEALAGTPPAGFEVMQVQEDGRAAEQLVLEKEAILTGDKLTSSSVGFDSYGQATVEIQFNDEGAKIFDSATFKNIGRRLAIVLDGKIHSAPVIRDRIPNGRGQISGNFRVEQASDLALILNAGALPAPVQIIEERTVGPSLGQDSIRKGLYASAAGAVFVVIFMAVYYLVPGLIASFAVLLNLLIIMGVMAKTGASLSLPGIAGIILTMGMAVDANVLINERMREEKKLGKAIRSIIAAGYHKSFSAILDSNVTTILSALILLWFGSGPVRGFAVTLTIGLLASMFTALFVTRVIFDYFTRDRKEINLTMMDIGDLKVDWMKYHRVGYIISIIVVGISLFGILVKGPQQLGIDFAGGTSEEIHLKQQVDMAKIRSALAKAGLEGVSLQNYGKAEENNILIRTKADSTVVIQKALEEAVGKDNFEIRKAETLGPSAGKEMFQKALKALGLSLLIMLIYVAWRFNMRYAIAGILALLHDSIVAAGVFFLMGRELSLPIIAALLTIIGFSLNDTIVIYDRIRENLKIYRKESMSKIINLCLNQMFSRTIITTVTTIFGAVALLLFGGPAINDFALVLFVGFLSGVYSTIFIATPLLAVGSKNK